jgi:DNA-binding XRE family transcriptional regulator
MESATPPAVSVDLTAIGRKHTRDWFRGSFETSGRAWSDFARFWDYFLAGGSEAIPDRTLVIGDLYRLAKHYRSSGAHEWVTSVRRARPIFLALVRTRRDEGVASLVDDMVRDSDLRMIVCRDTQEGNELQQCLTEALRALEPDSILEVRYSPARDNLWLLFGDGLSGTVEWSDLGIVDLREELIAESACVGGDGRTLELARADGGLFEIDSLAIRSALDHTFAAAVPQEAADSAAIVGQRLRQARQDAGLTQVELSRRTDIDQAVISRLERGKHHPRLDTLRRIAGALNMSVSRLLAGGGDQAH